MLIDFTFGQDRYRVPIMPLYCLFAGYASQRLRPLIYKRVPASKTADNSDAKRVVPFARLSFTHEIPHRSAHHLAG